MASFEEQLTELEGIVTRLEQGNLSLEENVSLFERGVQLSEACRKILSEAESRVRVLVEPNENGAVRSEEMALDVAEEDEDEESYDDGRL